MRFLVTGAAGQVGSAFAAAARGAKHDVVATVHRPVPGVDPGLVVPVEDAAAVAEAVQRARPDWVVHAAAMTNVDACERDPAAARAANALGTEHVAAAARAAGARLIAVSTDYVFDGARGSYREDDAPNPINAYGASKLEGERRAVRVLPDAVVARTSAVFAPGKRNFVTWVIGELQAGKRVRVARDQVLSPTLGDDVAGQLLALTEAGARGVWHTAGASALGRVEAARRIAAFFGLDAALLDPVAADELPWVAKRPARTDLDVTRIRALKPPLTFDEALERFRRGA